MVAGELSWTAVFQDDWVDDVTAEARHAPPPRLVACTMSCDIGELCAELRHLAGRQVSTCNSSIRGPLELLTCDENSLAWLGGRGCSGRVRTYRRCANCYRLATPPGVPPGQGIPVPNRLSRPIHRGSLAYRHLRRRC